MFITKSSEASPKFIKQKNNLGREPEEIEFRVQTGGNILHRRITYIDYIK